MKTEKDISIILIGAGNLATQAGLALTKGGYTIEQVFSRTKDSAGNLADKLHAQWTTSKADILKEADFYIFSVKDDALEELIKEIVPGRKGVFLHTAGSMPMDVFKTYAKHYGVAYPMQTFSKTFEADFNKIPCFVECSDYSTFLETIGLFGSICGSIHRLDSEKRKYLHLAAVFACNFTNHCYALADKILQEQGIPFRLMQPLVEETARKAFTIPPKEAQTGPAVRFDETIIRKQEALLKDHPEMQKLYDVMSKSIHQLSQENYDKL